jgi:hypothetical protein
MSKGKFTEGQVYEFVYIKNVILDEEFLVFEDKDKERYLLPLQNYKDYNLELHKTVKCLISRVDCKGKISIEPEHPYYKIGETYDFKFVQMLVTEDAEFNPVMDKTYIKKDYEIIVEDIFGNTQRVVPKRWQRKKRYVAENTSCKVVKIIQGRLLLQNVDEPKPLLNKVLNTLITKIGYD